MGVPAPPEPQGSLKEKGYLTFESSVSVCFRPFGYISSSQ